MDDQRLNAWLAKVSERLSEEDVLPRQRPWEAWRRLSMEEGVVTPLGSPLTQRIFDYFNAQTKPGELLTGPLYKAPYFFDGSFWTVEIPIVYGTVRLSALDALVDMPDSSKERLMRCQRDGADFSMWWADCVDYGFGVREVMSPKNDLFGVQLFTAGVQELTSAAILLLDSPPKERAVLNSRMATELLLKAMIAFNRGLTEKEARKIDHNLHEGLTHAVSASGNTHLETLRFVLDQFPPHKARYEEQKVDRRTLWQTYAFAHLLGTLIVRQLTDRDTFSELLRPTPQSPA